MIILVETLIVALVAYRLWRLIAIDTISQPIRRRIEMVSRRYSIRRRTKAAAWALDLIECPWCAGTWIALGVAFGAGAIGWVTQPALLVGLAAAVILGVVAERVA